MLRLMEEIRESISAGTFMKLKINGHVRRYSREGHLKKILDR